VDASLLFVYGIALFLLLERCRPRQVFLNFTLLLLLTDRDLVQPLIQLEHSHPIPTQLWLHVAQWVKHFFLRYETLLTQTEFLIE